MLAVHLAHTQSEDIADLFIDKASPRFTGRDRTKFYRWTHFPFSDHLFDTKISFHSATSVLMDTLTGYRSKNRSRLVKSTSTRKYRDIKFVAGATLLVLKLGTIIAKFSSGWQQHHAPAWSPQPVHVHVHNSLPVAHNQPYAGWMHPHSASGPEDEEHYYYRG